MISASVVHMEKMLSKMMALFAATSWVQVWYPPMSSDRKQNFLSQITASSSMRMDLSLAKIPLF